MGGAKRSVHGAIYHTLTAEISKIVSQHVACETNMKHGEIKDQREKRDSCSGAKMESLSNHHFDRRQLGKRKKINLDDEFIQFIYLSRARRTRHIDRRSKRGPTPVLWVSIPTFLSIMMKMNR